jgi:cation-transporting ATPase E
VSYPLIPAQLSLISLFTIGVPAFLLSQAPTKDLIRGSFVLNVMHKALPIGLTDFIIVALTMLFGYLFGLDWENMSTVSAILVLIAGFIAVWRAAQPRTPFKMVVFCGCLLGSIICYIVLPDFFGMSHMSIKSVALLLLLASVIWPVLTLVNIWTNWFLKHANNYAQKLKKRRIALREKILQNARQSD